MEQPPGYVAHGENKVYRLRNTIYGLKQSPRAWWRSSTLPSMTLVFTGVTEITLYSSDT